MCRKCEVSSKGLRSGKGSAFISKYLLGRRACNHTPTCSCELCREYREQNPYADTGLFLSQTDESPLVSTE